MFLKKINRADVLSILQKEDALIKTLEANGGGYRFDNETSSRTFYGANKEDLFTFERNTDFDKTLTDNALNIPYADTKKGNWLGGIDILNARAKIIKSLNSMSSIRLKTDEDIPIYMPEPPRILSTSPNGVFIESKATVPTISNLFILFIN